MTQEYMQEDKVIQAYTEFPAFDYPSLASSFQLLASSKL